MKNEGFDQLTFARRIRRAGRPIHIPEDDGDVRYIPSAALRVYQTGGIIESTAFDLSAGTGFKINLVVTSTVSGSPFLASSSSYRGSTLMSNGSKIPT